MGHNGTGSTQVALTCEDTMFYTAWNKLRIREKKRMGRRQTGQEAFIFEKAMCCAVWNKISSRQSDVSTTEFGDKKM
jgi:hypothetical protein